MTSEVYCCSMRRYFLLGVVGTRKGEAAPIDVADFAVDFQAKPIVLRIKFCPFCGSTIDDSQTTRVIGPQ